jgi:hypothetical protein
LKHINQDVARSRAVVHDQNPAALQRCDLQVLLTLYNVSLQLHT